MVFLALITSQRTLTGPTAPSRNKGSKNYGLTNKSENNGKIHNRVYSCVQSILHFQQQISSNLQDYKLQID
jgi:hypothetical protein